MYQVYIQLITTISLSVVVCIPFATDANPEKKPKKLLTARVALSVSQRHPSHHHHQLS
jgi:hypothetical protein